MRPIIEILILFERSKVDLYYVKNLKARYSIAKQDLRIQKLQKLATKISQKLQEFLDSSRLEKNS
jgi:hypothetical protein